VSLSPKREGVRTHIQQENPYDYHSAAAPLCVGTSAPFPLPAQSLVPVRGILEAPVDASLETSATLFASP